MTGRISRRHLSALLTLLTASALLVSVASCAKKPAATFEVVDTPPPQIESITHGAPNGAKAGDTVSITLRGDASLSASASLPGLVEQVPLKEDGDATGVYRGSFVVPEGKTGAYGLNGRLELKSDPEHAAVMSGPPLNIVKPPPPPAPRMTARDFNAQKVLQTIHFDFDKYDLRADALAALEANARWLKDHAEFNVVIEGHCDERGTNEYNMALGDRRANAARNYLIDSGIDAARLRTISYGEERPVAEGHDEAAWARNRRAEFVLED